jgi:polar amino acid transport system permease protein
MLKATSLASVIAAQELLTSVQVIYARNLLVIELLIVASIWYLALTTVLYVGQWVIERRLSRGFSARMPRTRVPGKSPWPQRRVSSTPPRVRKG